MKIKSKLIYIMSRYSYTKEKYYLTFYGIYDENAPELAPSSLGNVDGVV